MYIREVTGAQRARGASQMTFPPLPPPADAIVPTETLLVDEKAVTKLVQSMIHRSGMSINQIAAAMGTTRQSLNQYRFARRRRPSLQWISRLAKATGATIQVVFPQPKGIR